LTQKGQINDIVKGGKIDFGRALEVVMDVASKNDVVLEGMQKLSKQFEGDATAPAPPPAYLSMLERLKNMS
jgi:hypothetical protein